MLVNFAKLTLITAGFLWILFPGAKGQGLVINELMSVNNSVLADEDGDPEDWIELYNAGSDSIRLEGYGLSDDGEAPFRWVFPDTVMAPGAFLLVWASGKDRATGNDKIKFFKRLGFFFDGVKLTAPPRPLHTNFRIKSDGEAVYLTHPSGNETDRVPAVTLEADCSYGRYPDGADAWAITAQPTPGAANRSGEKPE